MVEPSAQELSGAELRPTASWVRVPDESGRLRLTMIWAVPDPLPPRWPDGHPANIRAAAASTSS